MMKMGMNEEIKDINQKVFQAGRNDAVGSRNDQRSNYNSRGSKKINFASLASDNLLKT